MVEMLKVYGERRMGTCFVDELMHRNLKVNMDRRVSSESRSRHDRPMPIADVDGYVMVVRNPFTWLVAFYENPFNSKHVERKTFSQFLESSCNSMAGGRFERWHPTPVHMWNDKMGEVLGFCMMMGKKAIIVKYENALNDAGTEVQRVAERFNLQLQSGIVELVPETMTSLGRPSNLPFERRKVHYDFEDEYKVRKYLNKDLMNALGYQI